MKELIYNVYIEDVNHNCFEIYNIFDHYSFVKDTQMNIKKNKENQSEFNEQLKSDIMYYFWAKSEWEIIVSSHFSKGAKNKKIDVYDQLMMNWKIFSDYIWNNKKTISKIKLD